MSQSKIAPNSAAPGPGPEHSAVAAKLHHHVKLGAVMALMLALLSTLLHIAHLGLIERSEHFFTAAVVSASHGQGGTKRRELTSPPDALDVQLLELAAELRVLALDEPSPSVASVQRLKGVRPLSRTAMAAILDTLAQRLAQQQAAPEACESQRPCQPKVLVLDFDIAPLPGDSPDSAKAMADALHKLRRYVDVVAVSLPRDSDAERVLRNRYMQTLQCSRAAPAAEAPAAAATAAPRPRHGLFFASPRLYLRAGESPLQYRADSLHKEATGARHKFPSPAQLALLLLQQPATDVQKEAAWQDLTLLCEQAHQSASTQLIEDEEEHHERLGAVKEQEHHWRMRYFNWPLLDSERLIFSPVAPDEAALDAVRRDRAASLDLARATLSQESLRAPVVLLSVEGSAGYDKYLTPEALPLPISGATYHALHLLSLDQPLLDGPLSLALAALADLLIGMFFVVVHSLFHVIFEPMRKAWTRSWALLNAVFPLLLCALLTQVAIWVGACLLLNLRFLFNPVFVLLGLLLHAYAGAWLECLEISHESKEEGHASAGNNH